MDDHVHVTLNSSSITQNPDPSQGGPMSMIVISREEMRGEQMCGEGGGKGPVTVTVLAWSAGGR